MLSRRRRRAVALVIAGLLLETNVAAAPETVGAGATPSAVDAAPSPAAAPPRGSAPGRDTVVLDPAPLLAPDVLPAPAPAPAGAAVGLHALLVNGGGRREVNYHSHLQHLKGVLAMLAASGVATENVTVFSGDGAAPETDLATREHLTESGLWLVPEGSRGRALRPPITYVDSTIDGVVLHPARKEALRAWFRHDGARLGAGDTLLFYVTDHGDKNEKDLANNTITLWGEDESLSVAELRALFAHLDPAVRVVMLMSQCYSGSFAHVIDPVADEDLVPDALPAGNVCGYFAATADRWAYGCYPENRGKEGIGHSHHFLEALADLDRFPEAQRRVLVIDRTPDVPHTTADFFLEERVRHAASAAGRKPEDFADELLAQAWRDRAAWEPEIRLLDRIGHSFGSFSPRSLAELEAQGRMLPEFSKRLQTYADRWKETLEALRMENLEGFLDAHPAWRTRLAAKRTGELEGEARRQLLSELLAELVPYTGHDPRRHARLRTLKRKASEAGAASYRAEVRLAVVLRMRALLTSIAGRVYMTTRATPEERAAYARLARCEDLVLTESPRVESAAALASPEPFPPLVEERETVEALMPAYMGIHFRPLPDGQRKRRGATRGAVAVMTVNPESPAEAAGLEVGDIILGPPGAPFTEPNQVREWTMLSEIGARAPLEILRGEEIHEIALRPGPYPLELPKLPGPPAVGNAAPPVKVEWLRGGERALARAPRLLYFWATWCVPCKNALPEMLAFAAARQVEIVAITDEEREVITRFLADRGEEPFPDVVGTDPLRTTFQGYGVSGTPTFVLVDAEDVVRHYQTGYGKEGLGVEGWTWR